MGRGVEAGRGLGEQKGEGKVDSHHLSRPASGAGGHMKVTEEPSRASPLPRRPGQGPMSMAELRLLGIRRYITLIYSMVLRQK